jgi:hypothetical protein
LRDSNPTRAETFEISPSQAVRAPIMHHVGSYPVVTDQGFSAIRVSFQIPQLHMVIVGERPARQLGTIKDFPFV